MKRECCGDFFPTLGKYRCPGRRGFVEMATLAETCPHCCRKISAHTHDQQPATRKLIVTEVFIEPIGWIEMEHEEAA